MFKKQFALLLGFLLIGLPVFPDTLVIGGQSGSGSSSTFEKYSDTGTLLLTGNLDVTRSDFSATKLASGDVSVKRKMLQHTSLLCYLCPV